MKSLLKLNLIALLAILVASCASTKQFKKFTQDEDLESDKARIYIVRTGNFGGFVKFNVFDNSKDNQMGSLGPKSYLCFDVTPEEHKIIAQAETERVYTINAQKGKTYYLRLIPKMGFNYARVNFEMLSAQEGKEAVKKLKTPKMYYSE
ncbi:DUF2846 domain-containing protein [Aquimarina sp. W85]|uniref:DUF2846 domain-containing protein n=1 Tax=Aquimarina rhodophyticola TaxID=3342246 RepID=UPI00366BB852